jgi:Ca-activated chloride channel family protein
MRDRDFNKQGLWFRLSLIILFILITLACSLGGDNGGPPRNATLVEVTANTSLTSWLENAVKTFNEAGIKTPADKPIFVTLKAVEAGQAVADMTSGAALPALWIPDNEVWLNVLAEQGQASFQGNCQSLATSPLVIAMWQPIAEALGWPGRSLGWLDIGSLAADPSAWAYYSGGQFGASLRIGHTHPGLSGSGVSTLLALVQAAQAKAEAVSVADIQQPIVQASVASFESSVSWFSPSTDHLGQTMRERGSAYLGAAVMYESTVVQYGGGEPAIIPLYPFEGSFMATHPACLNAAASPESQEAARLFRDYLLGEEAQQMAVANGLRPVQAEVTPGSPLDEAHRVDLTQPEVVFNPPTVETLYAMQTLWQMARKDINLVMLLDSSGSMQGDKVESMKVAAVQFVEQMGDEDFITLITFASTPVVPIYHQQLGPARQQVVETIKTIQANGDTALYDAISDGASFIENTTSSQTSNTMIILSDGQDTSSRRYRQLTGELLQSALANETTIFTIAYGEDADEDVMAQLASQGNGNFYKGNEANIAAIYQEMSAAFGGSVGVGR